MGSPSRTRLQSLRSFSCWGPSLPWLLQPQRLRPQLRLIPTMAMATVATDTVDTTDLMATMAIMERGPLKLSQSPLLLLTQPLWLTLLLMLMPGTATTATDTVAMDTVATDTEDTTALMATMATDTDMATTAHTDMATMAMERDPQRLRQSPLLLPTLLLWLTPLLMLMPGTATTAMVATVATATTATDTDTATTAHTDMPTGAEQAKREVDSSSDCAFPSTLASISRACA